MASGYDEVVFNISIWDPLYPQLVEEASIRDRDQQWYLIKQINGGSSTAKIVAQLDLDAWKESMYIGYSNNSATLDQTILGIIPQGWSLVDSTGLTMRRTIEGDYTPLEILEQCRDTYGVYFKFNNVAQTVTVVIPDAGASLGAFATRQLNLKEINYKGKSNDLVTRLYAYGKDGLSFASINGGLPYVENTSYANKIISAVWRDDRYTIAENLLADAKATLAASCVPSRSYDCDVVDLRKTNPELYGFQNFDVFSVATLIDDAKGFAINYQVVERWEYPYYPEKNKVIFSSSPAKIQSQVTQLTHAIESPNSGFQQQMQAAINNATAWITGTFGGYVVIHKNDQGQPYEILIMDQPTIDAASKVWRWNNGGLGYSGTGYNGPYTTAITQDGAIVANFITSGTLNAALVNVINLVADNITSGTLDAAKIRVINLDASNINTGTLNADLINAGTLKAILISSNDGASYWNLGTGQAVFANATATGTFSTVSGALQSTVRDGGFYSYINGQLACAIYGYTDSGQYMGSMRCFGQANSGGMDDFAVLRAGLAGGEFALTDANGNQNCQIANGVIIANGLGISGTKNRIVSTSFGRIKMHALESPQPRFEDFGTGICDENGLCVLTLDPRVEETISRHQAPIWQITPNASGAMWVEPGWVATVHGAPGQPFTWSVSAPQIGFEEQYTDLWDELSVTDAEGQKSPLPV